MAELFLGGLVGSGVDKLLGQVLKVVKLAVGRNKNWEALHKVLVGLQPVVESIAQRNNIGEAAVNWLDSISTQLKYAQELLEQQDKAWNIARRVSSSKKLLETTQELRNLLLEVATLHYEDSLRRGQLLERELQDINSGVLVLQENVSRLELAQATRHAFSVATFSFGSRVRTITSQDAVRDIKYHADLVTTLPAEAHGRDDMVTLLVEPRAVNLLRRQETGIFGGNQVVEQVQTLLVTGKNPWVGLWATGGAGKTHTVERIYNSTLVQNHFVGGTLWITVGRQQTARNLLQKVIQMLQMSPQPLGLSDDELKNRLCNHLQEKKDFLMVLDDAWEAEVLTWLDVLPRGQGNKMLVTTRNVELLDAKHAAKVQVPLLSKEHSWKLFCFHAFRGEPSSIIRDTAEQIADECKGLPLALKVVGGTMASKKYVPDWHLALQKLRNADVLSQEHEKQLFFRLQPSVDDLSGVHQHLKDCFFYFAAFPEDTEIEVTKDMLSLWLGEGIVGGNPTYAAEDEAYELLGWLIARSLVELREDKHHTYMYKMYMKCKVHDVLRDLARYNLQHDIQAEKRDCLYEAGRPNDFPSFPEEWLHSPISATRLSLMYNNITQVPSSGFKASKLRVLLLRNNPIAELPSSFLTSLNNLRVVDVRSTHISKLPSSIGQLRHLVVLQLSNCGNLISVPSSISELKALRELHLANCKRLRYLPSSYSKLTSLEKLDLSGNQNLWTSLRPFWQGLVTRAASLDDTQHLIELKDVKLSDKSKNPSLAFFKPLKKLRNVELDFPELQSLPADFQGLEQLEELTLRCRSLQVIPDWITHCSSLKIFTITNGPALTSELPALNRLLHLRELSLTNCSSLKSLPSSFGNAASFPSLEELSLYACDQIASFPALEAGAMPKLLSLNLSGWVQLEHLPASLERLKTLRSLQLNSCFNLQSLDETFNIVACFPDLEELELDNTKALKELPQDLGCLPRLRMLHIERSLVTTLNPGLEDLKNQGKLEIKM